MKQRVAIAALCAAACLVSAASSVRAEEKVTYLLPAPTSQMALAPWMLAKHLGYYKEAGYDVDFVVARGGVDVAKQVGVGNAPIGGAIGDTPIIVRGNGVPVKAVGLMGGGALTVVVARKDRGIQKLDDLKGRKVSVMAFQDTTYFALLGALATRGIGKDEISAEAVGPAGVPQLMIAGSVDACACTPEWEVNVKEGLPPSELVSLPTNAAFPSMPQAILASDEIIAKRPELVRGIVKATLRGMKFVMDDPANAAKAYVEAVPSFAGKEDLVRKVFANFMERTYKGQKVLGAFDPEQIAKLQTFYLKQGFIQSALPVDQLYTNDFIK